MSLSFYHAMLTFLSVFYDGNLEQKNHISNDKIKGRKIQLIGSKSYSFMQIQEAMENSVFPDNLLGMLFFCKMT